MATIGVRELRRDASRWLARVRAGESVIVTDRGKPVAKMVPIQESGGYSALLAEGRIAPGPGRSLGVVLRALDKEVPPDAGMPLSDALAALRAEER